MIAWDEALCLQNILTEFVNIASCTREITCALDASAHGSCLHFKTMHVIGLPAVERQVKILQLLQHSLRIYAYFGISASCHFICLVH